MVADKSIVGGVWISVESDAALAAASGISDADISTLVLLSPSVIARFEGGK